MSENSNRVLEEARRAIDACRERYLDALRRNSVTDWLAEFTDDAVHMPPHAPANLGKAAVAAWGQALLMLFRSVSFSAEVHELRVLDHWAFERGVYRCTLAPHSGGEPVQDNGKYLMLYRRQPDGEWKIARDIWNSDLPPAV